MPEYSNSLLLALIWGRAVSLGNGKTEICPEDLLLGVLKERSTAADQRDSVLSPESAEELSARLRSSLSYRDLYQTAAGDIPLSHDATELMESAAVFAGRIQDSSVQPMHLLWAMVDRAGVLAECLKSIGV